MDDIVDPFDSNGIVDPFESKLPSTLRPARGAPKTKLSPEDQKWLRDQRPSTLDRIGAAGRAATRAIFPTATAAAGASTGAALGAMTGPLAEVGIPLGFVAGGVLGGLAGDKAQQGALSMAPKVAETMGQTGQQRARDETLYPLTTMTASVVPALITGNALQRATTPKGSAAERFLPSPTPREQARNIEIERLDRTRAAADRQGVKLPTTTTSPTGYRLSRIVPKVVGTDVIDTAERKAPEAVGEQLDLLAQRYHRPTERGAAGEAIQESAARKLENLRQTGGDRIEEANRLAAGVKLPPTQTLTFIDKTLGEMSVNSYANDPFIRWLSAIKGDLLNPDNPQDVAALRDLRHSLYRQTSPEGIAAGDKARLAGELWTRLSADIRDGLTAAQATGNEAAGRALTAFDEGSALWAKRKALYDRALKKVIGSDFAEDLSDPSNPIMVAQKPPEAAWDAVRSMTANDRRAFQKTMANLDPDAQDSVRASIIASLGRDKEGAFVPSKFLSDMHQMAPQTRIALFGRENVAAMDDLHTIVKNLQQIEPRKGGWGEYAVPGALAGVLGLTGGGAQGAGMAFMGAVGASAATARVLARPDSLRWLARLARSSQKGVDAFNQTKAALAKAARGSPTLGPLYQLVDVTDERMAAPKADEETKAAFDPSTMSDAEIDALIGEIASTPDAESPGNEDFDLSAYSGKAPPDLVTRVAQVESGGDPNAVSPKGAQGVMQLMPETQKDPGFGVEPVADKSTVENVRMGGDYLQAMIDRYGDPALGLMAYNWGPGNVDNWLANGRRGPVPRETQEYVRKILGNV